jgi:hypothetical protein
MSVFRCPLEVSHRCTFKLLDACSNSAVIIAERFKVLVRQIQNSYCVHVIRKLCIIQLSWNRHRLLVKWWFTN